MIAATLGRLRRFGGKEKGGGIGEGSKGPQHAFVCLSRSADSRPTAPAGEALELPQSRATALLCNCSTTVQLCNADSAVKGKVSEAFAKL